MKKLAKVVLMLAVAVLTALGLFACTDTGEDPNNGENPGGGMFIRRLSSRSSRMRWRSHRGMKSACFTV